MSSIVENLLKESSKISLDSRSLKSMNMMYLLEADGPDEKKIDTAMQKSAKALKLLTSKLVDMKQTAALVAKAGANMTNAVASGEKDEEAAALFSLSNQFGSSLLGMLNSIQNALETESDVENESIANVLGGEDALKKIIEKTFKPSTTSLSLIKKANDLVAKVKDITATGASSESDEPKGRSEQGSIFEIEDVKDIDEGPFTNALDFVKGLFKKVPADTVGTIKSLMPLFGGANIAKALLTDLKTDEMTSQKFSELLTSIKPTLEELAPGSEKVQASPAPESAGASTPGATGGASPTGAPGGGDGGSSGGGGDGGAAGGGSSGGGGSREDAAAPDGGAENLSLSSMLFQSKSTKFRSKAKLPEKAGKIRQAFEDLGIIKPGAPIGDKKKLLDKAKKILTAADALKDVKLESSSNENDVILERWQRLAGLKD